MRQDVLEEFVAAARLGRSPRRAFLGDHPRPRARSLSPARALAFLGVKLDVSLDLDARCTGCGAERDIPGKAERVLNVDGAMYAEFTEPCERCGGCRVRIKVHTDGSVEASPHEDGPTRRRT